MANQFTIILGEAGQRREAVDDAGGILPGMLIERTSDAVDTVVVHATAGAKCLASFAVEDDIQGNTVTDAYAIGDVVQYETFKQGDRVMARLASGESATKGDPLASNGDGYLKVGTPATDHIVAYAAETVDASLAAKFINVEIA